MCSIARSLEQAASDQIKQAKLIECRVGLRPVSRDWLPIIGWVPQPETRILLATGHGANGLSWGPYTGKLIADIITGEPPEIDLAPFAPDRFTAASRATGSSDKEQS
jgi:D-amino-acid dehydrogenase